MATATQTAPANQADGNAAPAGEKKTRASRSNHAAASLPITNRQEAQGYVDAVNLATASDTFNSQYNNNGFVTPGRLNTIPVAGRLRMACSIIASLAASTASDPTAGAALGVIGEYSGNAGIEQERSRQFQSLLSAARIMNPGFKGTDMDLVNHFLKGSNTTWEKVSQGIRAARAATA